jgi:hypothetical protein
MALMARKRIEDIIAELRSWLPDYDRGDDAGTLRRPQTIADHAFRDHAGHPEAVDGLPPEAIRIGNLSPEWQGSS